MSKTDKIVVKKPEVKRVDTVSYTSRKEGFETVKAPADEILYIRNNVGNQTVQLFFKYGMIKVQYLTNSLVSFRVV